MSGAGAPQQKVSPELQQFILQEQAKAQIQQTVARLTDECWDKCISSPGNYLSSRENSCLENCARRFLETTQFVVKIVLQGPFTKRGDSDGGDQPPRRPPAQRSNQADAGAPLTEAEERVKELRQRFNQLNQKLNYHQNRAGEVAEGMSRLQKEISHWTNIITNPKAPQPNSAPAAIPAVPTNNAIQHQQPQQAPPLSAFASFSQIALPPTAPGGSQRPAHFSLPQPHRPQVLYPSHLQQQQQQQNHHHQQNELSPDQVQALLNAIRSRMDKEHMQNLHNTPQPVSPSDPLQIFFSLPTTTNQHQQRQNHLPPPTTNGAELNANLQTLAVAGGGQNHLGLSQDTRSALIKTLQNRLDELAHANNTAGHQQLPPPLPTVNESSEQLPQKREVMQAAADALHNSINRNKILEPPSTAAGAVPQQFNNLVNASEEMDKGDDDKKNESN